MVDRHGELEVSLSLSMSLTVPLPTSSAPTTPMSQQLNPESQLRVNRHRGHVTRWRVRAIMVVVVTGTMADLL